MPDLTPAQLARCRREFTAAAQGEGADAAVAALMQRAPEMASGLPAGAFRRWARAGVAAARTSPAVATAYASAAAEVLQRASHTLDGWLDQVQRLEALGPDAAAEFLQASPRLAAALPEDQFARLLDVVSAIPSRPAEMALSALRAAAGDLVDLGARERAEALNVGRHIAATHPWAVGLYFQTIALLAPRMAPEASVSFIESVESLADLSPLQFSAFLKELATAPRTLNVAELGVLLPAASRLATRSVGAAHELLASAPSLFQRLEPEQLALWCQRGEEVLRSDEGAGVSYFRLQGRPAQQAMASISASVALEEVRDVLQMYSQALMGRDIHILAAEGHEGLGGAWVEAEQLGLGAPTIFAPALMQGFAGKDLNFEAYKVLVTHQTGHITFGTYDFVYEGEGNLFRSVRALLAAPPPDEATADLERYFALFQDKRLARDLFTLADDERIDALIREEYRGIRRPYQRVQDGSLEGRPRLEGLPLREYVIELLVRRSIGYPGPYRLPERLAPQVAKAAGILSLLTQPEVTPEDVAEAAIRLYILIRSISNIPQRMVPRDGWIEITLEGQTYDPAAEDLMDLLKQFARLNPQAGPFPGDAPAEGEEEEEEEPFMPPPPVPHRGDHQPELMQLLMHLQERAGTRQAEDGELSNAEMLQEMMDRQEETEEGPAPDEEQEGVDYNSPLSRYLRALYEKEPAQDRPSPIIESVAEEDVQVFHYDEWDYRIKAYRPGWCELHQRTLREGSGESYEKTLLEHQWLAHAVRKQFEMLRPEGMGRVKRLLDGEEFDLDAVIESVVDKKAGDGLKDKVYWRRRKTQRSVAVSLLLDMSLSTDERIDQDIRFFSAHGMLSTEPPPRVPRNGPGKRIIDLEKESLVLLMEALEQLGDEYAIYGFSSAGRGDIQFFIIKDFEEQASPHVRNRLDKIVPLQGTRMGAAIRHAAAKLEDAGAETRVLLLVSDGRPQDRGYGTLPWELEDPNKGRFHALDSTMRLLGPDGIMADEKDYAVHDTKEALNEAKLKGIMPFCLSIDKEGHDYLKAMCGDIGYEVVSTIEALPRRLPALYRRLTT